MPELIPTATEADWLAARRKGITASEIAIVMGLSPYGSPYALYHQKLGILDAPEQAEEMEFGTFCEPYIARKFAERHPDLYVAGDGRELYAHQGRPWQMATPDRCAWESDRHYAYRRDPVAVVECKSDNGSDEWGEPGTDEIPVHYRCQVLWQMDVMGVSRAYVPCLGRDRKVREYVIEHHPSHAVHLAVMRPGDEPTCDLCEDIVRMRDAARDFLDRIDAKEVPDTDWHPATGAALRGLYDLEGDGDVEVGRQLGISYRAAVRRSKEAERRKDEMTNRVLAAMGNGRRAVDYTGAHIATRSVSRPRRIDVDRLRSEQPAIAAEYAKPPKAEVKLLPAKPKKES